MQHKHDYELLEALIEGIKNSDINFIIEKHNEMCSLPFNRTIHATLSAFRHIAIKDYLQFANIVKENRPNDNIFRRMLKNPNIKEYATEQEVYNKTLNVS